MERNITIEEVLAACPFINKNGKIAFPYKPMRDMVYMWNYFHPIKFGKGLIKSPKGYEDRYEIGVGVVLATGPGYYDKEEKWIPVNDNIIPGVVVEFDLSIPWTFPMKIADLYDKFHTLPMCPSVNIFGVYSKE